MMSLTEYSACDATDLASLVKRREVSARELAQTALVAVDVVNDRLNAVIEVYPERLDNLDDEYLAALPLGGVPFFFKDLGPTEVGKKSEWGSHFSAGMTAEGTTFLTDRFHAAGLSVLGRTSCPEFGFTISTESRLNGVTRNPWDTELTPGGSSGGSAAIVAAGVVPIAHTNDGAGSTRVPASICGLVGLKCSRGTVSLGPGAGDVMFPLYSEFVASRSVRDTEAVLNAISGPMPGESVYSQLRVATLRSAGRRPRIAMSRMNWGGKAATPAVRSAVLTIVPTLEALGFDVDVADPAIDFAEFHKVTTDFYSLYAMVEIDMMARALGKPVDPFLFEPVSYRLYEQGKSQGLSVYLHALDRMNQYSRALGSFFERFDYYVTPTLATTTPKAGALSLDRDIAIETFHEQWAHTSPYCSLANFTGIPAVSLPLLTHADGTPLGVMFMAPIGAERDLLSIAYDLEAALPWVARRPAVHVARAAAALG
ncbi:amidase [Novosphingobium sp. SG751A]|uniref:amidase n=1 Tax=Novosphingobium sp. SG751A TaxID=2587000 RepID=UPI0015574F1E|nr:amidase [Novosphingobium sp. SG751A]NOW44927.1 amidase [Novosphingobium sp. SG751A]